MSKAVGIRLILLGILVALLAAPLSALVWPVSITWASDFQDIKGPFPVRNFNPIQLMFLTLPVEAAPLLPAKRSQIRMEMAESSVILSEQHSNPDVDAVLKFETFRFAFALRYGISDRLEAGIEIPVLYRDKGVLDPFIISIEDAFKRLSPKRLKFSRGAFGGFYIDRNGDRLLSGERGDFGLGDISLHTRYLLWQETPTGSALSVHAGIKLPTGREDLLFGRDQVDLGLGLSLQKRVYPKLALHFSQDVVFPLGRFLSTGFTLNPISTTVLALEWIRSSRFSWLLQFDLYTSPFHGTGVSVLDTGVFELAFGFDYALRPHVLWQLYLIENLNKPFLGSAADFTLATTVSYGF